MFKNKKPPPNNKRDNIFKKLNNLFDDNHDNKLLKKDIKDIVKYNDNPINNNNNNNNNPINNNPINNNPINNNPINNNNNNHLNILVPNQDIKLGINSNKPIEICLYQVVWHINTPFLLFLLNKQNDSTLSFVEYINSGSYNPERLKNNIIKYISTFFPVVNITYSGYYETIDKNVIILRYEDNYNYNSNITTEQNSYLWCTVYEIINVNKVYNYNLNNSIHDFFNNNVEFIRIMNVDGNYYETPIICYYKTRKSDNIDEIDIYRETIIPSLPKSYYLYSSGCIPKISDSNSSIVRIAVFKGKLSFKDIDLYNTDNSYDTLFYIYKNVNRYFIIRNYSQHIILSLI